MAQTIMIIGAVLFLLGALFWLAPWLFTWFGNLPGDIRYEGERTSVFIPVTSMLVVSIVGSLLLSLLRK